MSAVILALLGTVAYAAMRPTDRGPAHQFRSSGRVKIKNSLGHKPIVGMLHMMPGDSVSGTVNIKNASKKVKANMFVGLSHMSETLGAGGGRFSNRLVLVVRRVSRCRRPQTLYAGPLRQMPLIKLGKFRRKETRTYMFTVTFPRGPNALDDRFMGGGVSLRFTWYARQAR
jgi:hypothetical protein